MRIARRTRLGYLLPTVLALSCAAAPPLTAGSDSTPGWPSFGTSEPVAVGFDLDDTLVFSSACFVHAKATFPEDRPARTWRGGHPSRRPIFIVGMPRSGTTLVEQILSAHTEVSTGAELPHINHLIANWADGPGRGAPYPRLDEDGELLEPVPR